MYVGFKRLCPGAQAHNNLKPASQWKAELPVRNTPFVSGAAIKQGLEQWNRGVAKRDDFLLCLDHRLDRTQLFKERIHQAFTPIAVPA